MTDEYMEEVSDRTGEEIDEPIELWVTALVEQGVSIRVSPEMIRDDETLEEYVEEEIERHYVGRIAAEIADGIRSSDIQIDTIEKETL